MDGDIDDDDEDGSRRGRQASTSASLCRQAEEEKAKGATVQTDAWSRDTEHQPARPPVAKSSVVGSRQLVRLYWLLQRAASMRSKNKKTSFKIICFVFLFIMNKLAPVPLSYYYNLLLSILLLLLLTADTCLYLRHRGLSRL